MFTEVAPGVYSVDHRHVDGKNGIVVGERAALAIDAGNYADEGQAMADFVRAQGRQANRLVLTHGHADHVLGSAAFRGGETFAHVLTPLVAQRTVSKAAERAGVALAQLGAQVAWPTITFSRELFFDLGGKHVRLFPTPGHSLDSISAFVEEDRVLFGGDTVFSEFVPAIGDGDGLTLESTLWLLVDMDIEVLVPGHGPVVYGVEEVRTWLVWLADYMVRVRAFVADGLERGDTPATVAEAASYQQLVGDRLPADRHGMVDRHRGVVQKVIQEELRRL
jgi:glyoxylase-like metal-dependent hydrolase (beta-lactamase superfamily II)